MATNPDMESVSDDDPTAALPVLNDFQKTETMVPVRAERRKLFRRQTDDELRDRVVKLEAKQRQQTILFEQVNKALLEKDQQLAALKAEVVSISSQPDSKPSAAKQRVLIRMVGTENVRHEFSESLKIGRAPGNDVCLQEGSVSRFHAELTANGDQTWLKDLGSKNGVFVNGDRAKNQALNHRDLIKIGEAVFRFAFTDNGQ